MNEGLIKALYSGALSVQGIGRKKWGIVESNPCAPWEEVRLESGSILCSHKGSVPRPEFGNHKTKRAAIAALKAYAKANGLELEGDPDGYPSLQIS